MFKNIKNWIKDKWFKVKRWLVVIFVGSAVLAAPLAIDKISQNNIPEHLKLKVPKEKILSKKEIGNDIKYLYISNNEVPNIKYQGLDEDISKRTKNAQFFKKGTQKDGKEEWVGRFYGGNPFYYDENQGKWYQTEIATTTIELYQKQTKKYPIEKIFAKIASAASGDAIYSIAGGDGGVYRIAESTWSTAQDSLAGDTVRSSEVFALMGSAHSNLDGYFIYRTYFPFDTSAIADVSMVTSATLSVYLYDKSCEDVDGDDWLVVVQSFQDSNDALTTDDYDECGDAIDDPTEGSDKILCTNWSDGSYETWTLDSTGLDWIDLTGYTMLGLREGHDVTDSSIGDDDSNITYWRTADYADTTSDPYLTINYLVQPTVTNYKDITINSSTSITSEGYIDLQDATSTNVFFTYGTSVPSGTTSTIQTLTTSSTFSILISSLTTLTPYFYAASATSSIDGYQTFSNDTFVVTAGDVATSTQTQGDWNSGTLTNVETSGDMLQIINTGGAVSTTTESFENVSDNTTIDANSIFYHSADGSEIDCWRGESTDTPSSGTGATDGSDGTIYAYVETSSGYCYTDGDTAIMQLDADFFVDNVIYTIAFDYNMYGTDIGTLKLQTYDDSTWSTVWSKTGEQDADGTTWNTVFYSNAAATTTDIRFHYTAAGGYVGDASVDYIRIATSTNVYTSGNRVSPAFDVSSITDVDSSDIAWAQTLNGDSNEVYVLTAVKATTPVDTDYATSTNGSTIAGISTNDDLTGMNLYVKVKLKSGTATTTPSISWITLAITQGAGGAVQRRVYIMFPLITLPVFLNRKKLKKFLFKKYPKY